MDKYYCPICKLQLTGCELGDSHVSPNDAWYKAECEYKVGQYHPNHERAYPLTEGEILLEQIQEIEKRIEREQTILSELKEQGNGKINKNQILLHDMAQKQFFLDLELNELYKSLPREGKEIIGGCLATMIGAILLSEKETVDIKLIIDGVYKSYSYHKSSVQEFWDQENKNLQPLVEKELETHKQRLLAIKNMDTDFQKVMSEFKKWNKNEQEKIRHEISDIAKTHFNL